MRMIVINFRGSSWLDDFLSFWGIRGNTCWNFRSRVIDNTSFLWLRVDILISIFWLFSSNNPTTLDWPIIGRLLRFTWENLFICNLRSCSLSTISNWPFNFITNDLLSSCFFSSYHIARLYIDYSSVSLWLLSFRDLLSLWFKSSWHCWWHLLFWNLSFFVIIVCWRW